MSWKNITDLESWRLIRNGIERKHRENEHNAVLFSADSVDPVKVRETSGSGSGYVQGKEIPENVKVVWAVLKDVKGNETPRAQALRFQKPEWSAGKAEDWLKANGIKFESFERASKDADEEVKYFEIIDQETEGGTADIFIFGHIGTCDFCGDVSAPAFKDEFSKITADKVNVHIHSPGGSVAEGFAIFNMLKFSDKKINTTNEGVAFSIAAFILLAGDTISLPKNTLLMFHNAISIVGGNAKDLEKHIKILNQIDKLLTDELVAKTKKPADEIKVIMAEERFFTGEEAVDFGIADNLMEPVKIAADFDASKFVNKNLDKYTEFLQNLKKEGNYSEGEPGSKPAPANKTGGHTMDWNEAQNTFKTEIDSQVTNSVTKALPEALKNALPTAVAEAVKLEGERIAGIDSLSIEGNAEIKKIIDAAKLNPKSTKENTAVEIIDAQNEAAKKQKKNIADDGKDLNTQLESVSSDPATPDEQKAADAEGKAIADEINAEKGLAVAK